MTTRAIRLQPPAIGLERHHMIDVVIDLSHHHPMVDFARLAKAGIVGVIHKATQGADHTDPRYAPRRDLAASVGLLWGSYHFGDGSPVAAQVDHFLAVATGGLRVLDVEKNPAGSSMSLRQAEEFVGLIEQRTGRLPVVYGGAYIRDALKPTPGSPLTHCPLWWAQYGPAARIPAAWKMWTLWQYTDRGTVDGVGTCDRDRYDGTEATLRAWWAAQ